MGRREGFNLDDVYVPLDVATSDLVSIRDEPGTPSREKSFVLLGGPGAGKSTWVKKRVRDWRPGRPFLVKLRDISGDVSILDHLVLAARRKNIPEPDLWLERQLTKPTTLVVLDGLDEVKPQYWDNVCANIDAFYKAYAQPDQGIALIVTCRKEAFRTVPLTIADIREVRPLTDQQIQRFASKWPLGYPDGKSEHTFLRDLQGTERILALVRSPLMLVGALMQYTESNLGIPEERTDYLDRIAEWLLEDWARAQGHPPDPWRKAYEPVLSRLAFAMHDRGTAEIERTIGVQLISRSLPAVGIDGGKAEAFIESLASKTGILVRDTPGHLVFSQFSLQEYFAAVEASASLEARAVTELSPLSWWRETILLAVARQPRPEQHFDALFDRDSLLGAASVAEHATPALAFQERAVDACLSALDTHQEAVVETAVALSRKVEGKPKRLFLRGLEERLQATEKEVVANAGRILAVSGTPAATGVLEEHPSVWPEALSRSGYLSSSFEDLLVDWIKGKDASRAEMAADILMTRLSEDRRDQLIATLPELPPARAETLAIDLIASFDDQKFHPWQYDSKLVKAACYCAPHLNDKRSFAHGRYPFVKMNSTLAKVAAALHRMKGYSPEKLLGAFSAGAAWSEGGSSLLFGLSSGILVMSMGMADVWQGIGVASALLIAAVALFLGRLPLPWVPASVSVDLRLPMAAVTGAAFALMLSSEFHPLSSISVGQVLVTAWLLAAMPVVPRLTTPRLWPQITPSRLVQIAQAAWLAAIIVLGAMTLAAPGITSQVGFWIGAAQVGFALYTLGKYWTAHRHIRIATKEAFRGSVKLYVTNV